MGRRRRGSPLPQSHRRLVAALQRWTVFRLDRAAAALGEQAERALDRHRLTLTSFGTLAVIEAHGPLSPAALADRVGVDRTTMSEVLDELGRHELVRRGAHPVDGRRRIASITAAGGRLMSEASMSLERAESRFLAILDDYEREDLRLTLRRLEPPERAVGDLHCLGPLRSPEE